MKTPKVFSFLTISTLSLLCYFLYSTDQLSQAWQLVSQTGLHQKNQSDGTDIQNIQLSFKATTSTIFDTCPLILYNHLDPQLLQFHLPDFNPMAKCRPYKPFTTLHRGRVYHTNEAKNYSCQARCLYNDHDTNYTADPWVDIAIENIFKCDIVETECALGENLKEAYIHMQIYESNSTTQSKPSVKDRPHLFLIILDSVSSFMAKRSLPRTIDYLKREFEAVYMEFLNKVGYNSKTNGFPLFFGKSIEGGLRKLVGLPPLIPDWDHTKECYEYLDSHPYYLEEYRKSGYKTMVAVDYEVGVVYYPRCKGFDRSEADHMWRAFDLRVKESDHLWRAFNNHCSERHLEMFEFMEKFMNAYKGIPKASHMWLANLAHDWLVGLYHADVQFLDFFKRNKKHFDNAFLFFMGDHGPRKGGILEVKLGRYENLNPFLMVSIPKSYRNTAIHKQLRNKSRELMTNFDLHATFMDILEVQMKSNFSDTSYREPQDSGSSLFREWRGPRNCRTLPIPSQYCICQYNWTDQVDVTVQKELGIFLANELERHLVQEGLGTLCHPQAYRSISSITMLVDGDITAYDVAIYLKPSGAHISALVGDHADVLTLYSGFSRLNTFGNQGDCLPIKSPWRPFCHCKTLKNDDDTSNTTLSYRAL
ncbi:hypothetical protein V3C99_010706 [Haemonchus contortus]|nr:Protein of unknown function DUF229 domain containing protein [Haemonchus contortus]